MWIALKSFELASLQVVTMYAYVYATSEPGQAIEPKAEEMQFPNGTIVGKYTYVDSQGNPVHVKYFADDSSYGVELKSITLSETNVGSNKGKEQLQIKTRDTEVMGEKINEFNTSSREVVAKVFEDRDDDIADDKATNVRGGTMKKITPRNKPYGHRNKDKVIVDSFGRDMYRKKMNFM